MNLRDYSSQLQQLHSEITSFDINTGSAVDSLELISKYQTLIVKFQEDFSQMIHSFGYRDMSFMASGHVTLDNIRSVQLAIENTKREIDSLIHEENDRGNHFRCFIIGDDCPVKIDSQKYLFFVGMPFNDQHVESYQGGIKAMLNRHGVDTDKKLFKADEQYSNHGILCKICRGIQESQNIIINISDQNPNVMFELGLAYGLNKNVFLIKDKDSAVISDLNGLEYTSYSNAEELASKLETRFREQGII